MQSSLNLNSCVPMFVKEGLLFSCVGCGACCCGSPGIVRLSQTEFTAIALYLGTICEKLLGTAVHIFNDAFRIAELVNGNCTFYKNKKCSIYPVRPLQCKTYPFWFSLLRNENAWEAEAKRCPGIGTGKLYTVREIENSLYMNPKDNEFL